MVKKRFALLFTTLIVAFSLALTFAAKIEAKGSLWDELFGNKEIDKTIEATIKAKEEGKVSLTSNISEMFNGSAATSISMLLGAEGAMSPSAWNNLTENQKQIAKNKFGNGAISDLGGAIAYMYTPPAQTKTYLADVFRSAKIIPEAHAQGLGFAALDPILETWKVFRNVAYLMFVVIFLVIGFMIMFRSKIGGQTVVTAQQAIPKIIIALIMVTFSYAIAGILIDLMYLLMYLLVGLFGQGNDLMSKSFIEIAKTLVMGSDELGSVSSSVQNFVTAATTASAGSSGSAALAFISSLTVGLIVSIAVVIGMFKLFLELLKTYVNIIIYIAFSPLILIADALPGRNAFKAWVMQIIGNLAAFPAVLLLLIMYKMVTEQGVATGGFMPPFMIGRGTGNAITTLVGIGIILAMPEAVKMIKEALGAKDGPFVALAKAAWKQAQAGEVAIPTIAGGTAALVGGTTSGVRGWQEGHRGRKLLKDIATGYQVDPGDADTPPTYIGGAGRLGASWWKKGMNVRRTIDRAQEGRLLEAEDIESTLTKIAERKAPEHEEIKRTGPAPAV